MENNQNYTPDRTKRVSQISLTPARAICRGPTARSPLERVKRRENASKRFYLTHIIAKYEWVGSSCRKMTTNWNQRARTGAQHWFDALKVLFFLKTVPRQIQR